MNKTILVMLFSIMVIPISVIIIKGRKREYDCLTPEEIEALRRYQAITDIVCPEGFEEDYSWVQ